MKLGAVDYLPKPFTPDQVRHTARRVIGAKLLQSKLSELQERLEETDVDGFFESESPAYRAFLKQAGRAAASEAVILLRGESGTGKNVLARWLRAHSNRPAAPFVSVNCPALSTDLTSSTLFGHRKGAFTGAVSDALGKVQEAEGGTLFLDEVGDLSSDSQARLLRFLNDRSFERLGEAKERSANVRILAATNRSLEAEVKAGRFRGDLLFRLNVVTLVLPPLRDRAEDLLPLAHHALAFSATLSDPLPAQTGYLRTWDALRWPSSPALEARSLSRPATLARSSRSPLLQRPGWWSMAASTSASSATAASASSLASRSLPRICERLKLDPSPPRCYPGPLASILRGQLAARGLIHAS